MELKIESKWATKLLSMVITKSLKGKLGDNATLKINSINLKGGENDHIDIHLDIEGSISKETLFKMIA